MADVKISELPTGNVFISSVVPVSTTNATPYTQKLTVGDIGSINFKKPVRVATTANLSQLYGTDPIDGIAISVGDRVLVKDQTIQTLNGIYIVSSSYWTRSTDFNSSDKIYKGQVVFVMEGQQNKTTTWMLTSVPLYDFGTVDFPDAPTLGTTPLSFVKCKSGNVDISGNYVYSTVTNGNVFVKGSGTGSVFVENLRISTRSISTDSDSNISISTRGIGTVLVNSNSNVDVIVGNLKITGETITLTENSTGNIVLSPSGHVIASNILLKDTTISSNSGNISINNISINGSNIRSVSGNITIGSNLVNITIGSNLVIFEGSSVPLFKTNGASTLFPLATQASVEQTFYLSDLKQSVRAATTSNISLSGTNSIDGVTLIVGDRILVKNQTNGIQNGIYAVGTNNWTRTVDADVIGEFRPNMFCFVQQGTINADTGWMLTNNRARVTGNVTVDGSYDFAQFAGPRNDVEILSISSDVTITNNSKKFQICDLQSNSLNMFLQTTGIRPAKEIIVKNSTVSSYNLNIYNGTTTSSLLKTISSNQTSWFVFDGTNWQVIMTSSV
jgi:hypothetical protein